MFLGSVYYYETANDSKNILSQKQHRKKPREWKSTKTRDRILQSKPYQKVTWMQTLKIKCPLIDYLEGTLEYFYF